MKHALMIGSLGQAFTMIKSMAPDDERWQEEAQQSARRAYKAVLESTMHDRIDRHLSELKRLGFADRRNGSFRRRLLSAVGEVELSVPRTRRFSAIGLIGAYRRRSADVDRAVLSCFLLGVSTRKVGEALQPLLGQRPSAGTVSRVGKQLDAVVGAFHRRRLVRGRYRFLIMDGVAVSVRSGGRRKKRVVLVVLGVLPDGRKEVLDFAVSTGESQAAWEALLESLYRRGLSGEGLELIICDGGKGLLAALPLFYPLVPLQRCWAHKARNIYAKVRKADWPAVKADLHAISYAVTLEGARCAMRGFRRRWGETYPEAVRCLEADEDQLLAFLAVPDESSRKLVRTTNAIERLFREVRRRTDPMGVFYDRTSLERMMFSVFTYHNQQQGSGAPFSLVTQNY